MRSIIYLLTSLFILISHHVYSEHKKNPNDYYLEGKEAFENGDCVKAIDYLATYRGYIVFSEEYQTKQEEYIEFIDLIDAAISNCSKRVQDNKSQKTTSYLKISSLPKTPYIIRDGVKSTTFEINISNVVVVKTKDVFFKDNRAYLRSEFKQQLRKDIEDKGQTNIFITWQDETLGFDNYKNVATRQDETLGFDNYKNVGTRQGENVGFDNYKNVATRQDETLGARRVGVGKRMSDRHNLDSIEHPIYAVICYLLNLGVLAKNIHIDVPPWEDLKSYWGPEMEIKKQVKGSGSTKPDPIGNYEGD